MSEWVLDASALLALLNDEEGAETVQRILPDAVISTVNLAEVVTRLAAIGMPEGEIRDVLAMLALEVVPFEEEEAMTTGLLYPHTLDLGLSLGDRACLAVARTTDAVAVTTDQAWGQLEVGPDVELMR